MRAWGGIAGLIVLAITTEAPVPAQRNIAGAVRTRLALEGLNVVGNALMIGAHPDDENTGLLAYLARGRHVRAAYLAATRGEGGQNLIGSEQGELLGLIRTQELLAARRIDGAEQFFTRAIDFGFSKTSQEALAKWDRDAVLADIVWNIRRFRPDVIIIQHSGTPADGHGHHQAVGILGKEAFVAAADKARFPEQLRFVGPWQARRMLGRGGGPGGGGQMAIDTGEFDPVLGFSYSEVAGMSRSMHKSQGMGAPEQRGVSRSSLSLVAGETAKSDMFDGIDMTWNRLPGGAAAGKILDEALRTFEPDEPEKIIPLLARARPLVEAIPGPQAALKLRELDEAIALCAGLWLDAAADRYVAIPGDAIQVNIEAINRSKAALGLAGVSLEGMSGESRVAEDPTPLVYNEPFRRTFKVMVPIDQPYSQPYWLRKPSTGNTYVVENQELIGLAETPAILRARFRIRVAGVRAYNVRADLRANQKRLLEYVEQGGTLVVQYNVVDRRTPALQAIGPYPIQLGSDRVSVEEAPVTFLIPGHTVLSSPNEIAEEDFQGWVQERGLNFASQWDSRYEALFESHDPAEKPLNGGTLYVRYGKGIYVFTAYSWFRQLPAGVPGAFRIFADFMSAGKSAAGGR